MSKIGLLTKAGIKRDSTWSVNEWTKLPGRMKNRVQMRTQFVRKRVMFRRKKKVPTPISHGASYGTVKVRLVFRDAAVLRVSLCEMSDLHMCKTLDTPPVAIV